MMMMVTTVVCCVSGVAPSSWKKRTPPPAAVAFRRRMIISCVTATCSSSRREKVATPAEVLRSLEGWAESNILPLLKPVDRSWQPHDLLPDSASPGFREAVDELRARAREIPDDYYVCLVGNMVTEEALPTYHAALNSFVGYDCPSSATAWARWSRGWTAEENRHGDLLNRYLYLSGRVDVRRVEQTIHHLINAGMRLASDKCPYRGFIYTAFQERATFISHGNTARRAKELGDTNLARICGAIAADEKRHEAAYTRVVDKLFELTPDAAVRALEYMMRERILMPAYYMFDGQDHNLFRHYAAVAQRLGVYTTADYADLVNFFVDRWAVAELSVGLTAEGRRAQDYVCRLPERVRKMDQLDAQRRPQPRRVPFAWVFDRQVELLL
ncbi:stearoyl-[acyl-carrier-protein] 9-desaturase, chloroplastic-like [Phragmites australis]|uniref:stearoyl-[acyl-carrier-protein] 9-desaturase, chloroplastic-like n=1 Tax=Phragmites australis TaxID=29695 RepID=UPI002D772735|nr:stearoyl-[acyl-carrier-protein] 9-desaturase, chloroplastic-like [Phragmites australis]